MARGPCAAATRGPYRKRHTLRVCRVAHRQIRASSRLTKRRATGASRTKRAAPGKGPAAQLKHQQRREPSHRRWPSPSRWTSSRARPGPRISSSVEDPAQPRSRPSSSSSSSKRRMRRESSARSTSRCARSSRARRRGRTRRRAMLRACMLGSLRCEWRRVPLDHRVPKGGKGSARSLVV